MSVLLGDMAVVDLTPKTTNIGDRLVKNMRICGSGIYKYNITEAPLLGLDPVPEKYKDLTTINVYRPPEVLEKRKDYFARIPIITGSHVKVDRTNAKQLAVGMVGDTVRTEVSEKDGELYLYTTGTIIAGDGADAYENLGELSVGYSPVIEWEEGEHNGEKYQAVLKDFEDINHLLICKTARGGHQCMVLDSIDNYSPLEKFIYNHGGTGMGIFQKIFGSRAVAGDSAEVVSTLLQSISVGADPETQVNKIRELVGDSDETFSGYLDELAQAKNEKPEIVAKAVDIVNNYYRENIAGDACMASDKITREKKEAGDSMKAVPIDAVHALANDKKKKEAKAEKEAGDKCPSCEPGEDSCPVCEGDEDKKEKVSGDSLDIDYDLLAKKIVEMSKVTGDAVEEKKEPFVGVEVPLTGDSHANKEDSEFFLKDIYGGQ